MTERLTRNSKFSFYNQNDLYAMYDKLTKLEDVMEDFNVCCVGELHNRLCLAEELSRELSGIYAILEKYGISVNELDNALFQKIVSIDNPFVKGYVQAKIDAVNRAEKDRDTWKRACELACEREDDCYVYDNIHRAYEFYQQAKKEGDTNV